ncbi:TetR/AcrR family transcriptional regulator [Actinospongicola halichondriae]|uniref:TetR/AcrR family transcriptional regulator n=1 Tax=Actinospongicola halichondriae TaxID=3236844 RepID=UPI003D4BA46E
MAEGRYAAAAEGLLRSTVLDSVSDLLVERDWDKLSMSAIATVAGVSRQTLYNEFGGRDGLAEAYVIREAGRFLDAVEDAVVAHRDSLVDAMESAMRTVLVIADTHPVLRTIVAGTASPELLDPLVSSPDGPVVDLAAGRLCAILEANWPDVDPDDFEILSDGVVRLALSHLTQPRLDIDAAVAAMVRVLSPYLRTLTTT